MESNRNPSPEVPPVVTERPRRLVLFTTVFVIAACGLVYELLAGALSSYLLGSSVTQFSVVIGMFLFAMGLGSYLSKFVVRRVAETFLLIEISVGLLGGFTPLALFSAFALFDLYLPLLVLCILAVGTLVGLEIPLLVRLLKGSTTLRQVLGEVLALDYLGALVASLLFPLLLLPWLGLVRTGFFFGLLNVLVSLGGLWALGRAVRRRRFLGWLSGLSALLLLAGLLTGAWTTRWLEDVLYQDEIVYATTTPYQRIVITRWRNDIRLFLDGNIQFSSADEFRYHEALVHPAMSLVPGARRILLLGGGDGLAAREVLKYGTVRQIDLVDLDPVMTGLFSRQPELVELNKGSLLDERLAVHNEDAWKFLEHAEGAWDVVLIDLPDPNNESLARLYTRSFYRLVFKHLSQRGLMVTQATSPFYATEAFWCIYNTVSATRYGPDGARPHVTAYHVDVPSFGDWGFVMAARFPIRPDRIRVEVPTRFLTDEVKSTLFVFSPDIAHRQTPVNRIDEPVLLRLYESGFRRYND